MMTKFTNAQEMAKKYPETFKAPTLNQLNNLKVGNLVKVCVEPERFWTFILEINGDEIKAQIDNRLIFTGEHYLKYKDVITFNKNNIYQIY